MPLIIQVIEQQWVLTGNEAAQLSHVRLIGKNCPPSPSPQLNGFYLISQTAQQKMSKMKEAIEERVP